MKQLAIRFEYPPLVEWSETLAEQVVTFDMDGMSTSLQNFPLVITTLKALNVA